MNLTLSARQSGHSPRPRQRTRATAPPPPARPALHFRSRRAPTPWLAEVLAPERCPRTSPDCCPGQGPPTAASSPWRAETRARRGCPMPGGRRPKSGVGGGAQAGSPSGRQMPSRLAEGRAGRLARAESSRKPRSRVSRRGGAVRTQRERSDLGSDAGEMPLFAANPFEQDVGECRGGSCGCCSSGWEVGGQPCADGQGRCRRFRVGVFGGRSRSLTRSLGGISCLSRMHSPARQ